MFIIQNRKQLYQGWNLIAAIAVIREENRELKMDDDDEIDNDRK